jgi:hypothetical protein
MGPGMTPPGGLAPVPAGARSDAVDSVRGCVLVGIPAVTMASFSHPLYTLLAGLRTAATPLDLPLSVWWRSLTDGRRQPCRRAPAGSVASPGRRAGARSTGPTGDGVNRDSSDSIRARSRINPSTRLRKGEACGEDASDTSGGGGGHHRPGGRRLADRLRARA